jgi:hypothetical protein
MDVVFQEFNKYSEESRCSSLNNLIPDTPDDDSEHIGRVFA